LAFGKKHKYYLVATNLVLAAFNVKENGKYKRNLAYDQPNRVNLLVCIALCMCIVHTCTMYVHSVLLIAIGHVTYFELALKKALTSQIDFTCTFKTTDEGYRLDHSYVNLAGWWHPASRRFQQA